MKDRTLIVPAALALFLALNLESATAFAQGTAFTYQGRLNSGGNPANGSYDISFALFATNSGGSAIAGPTTNTAVAVSNGLFTTMVDFGGIFTGANYWLAIGVRSNGSGGAFVALSPRQPITPAPYSIFANTANNLLGAIPVTQFSGIISPANLPDGLGGADNTASGAQATVGGGAINTASSLQTTVSGGYENTASNFDATVSGGSHNTAGGSSSTVSGGEFNTASGEYASVPGGYGNIAGGQYSFAAGQRAQALHQGSFVWADSQNAPFSSTANDQFLIRAQGGVGIGTASPAGQLTLGNYQGGTLGSAVSNFTKQVVLGGDYNTGYNFGNSVKLLISDYDNDSSDIYPIYVEDENNGVDFYLHESNGVRTAYFGGNVSIGTTNSPFFEFSALQVNGNIQLGIGGTNYAASGQENLRIIRGVVNGDGSISSGSGFTVYHFGTGIYIITFTQAFGDYPAVTVSPRIPLQNQDVMIENTGLEGDAAFEVNIYDLTLFSAPTDDEFTFTAIGAPSN